MRTDLNSVIDRLQKGQLDIKGQVDLDDARLRCLKSQMVSMDKNFALTDLRLNSLSMQIEKMQTAIVDIGESLNQLASIMHLDMLDTEPKKGVKKNAKAHKSVKQQRSVSRSNDRIDSSPK